MDILYVTAQTPWGGEEFILPEVLAIRALGHRVLVVPVRPAKELAPGREAASVAEDAIRLPLLGCRTLFFALLEFARHPLAALRVAGRVVRCTEGRVNRLRNVVVFPKALAVAWVARRQRIEHVHAHWASTPSTVAYVVSQLTGIPWSLTAHRWDIAANNMLVEKVRTASFVRAIDHRGSEEIRSLCGAALAPKVQVIHMGVSLASLGSISRRRWHKLDVPLLVCPANFVPKKGHVYLLNALALVRSEGLAFQCWLFGKGPLENELKGLAMRLGLLDREVKFQGRLPHDELLELFHSGCVDVVVLPSIETPAGEREGIPVALIEAMAAGIPVVAARSGGIPELVEGAGELVTPADPVALANAIANVLRNERLRKELSLAGVQRVRQAFTIETVVGSLLRSMVAHLSPGATWEACDARRARRQSHR